MSQRTLIEINHDQLHMLEKERDCVFPQLLHALRSGEGPMWVGRSFVSGDGIRILGQRHHSEPEWAAPRVMSNTAFKSELKRLVALVFGEGFEITRRQSGGAATQVEVSELIQALDAMTYGRPSHSDWKHADTLLRRCREDSPPEGGQ